MSALHLTVLGAPTSKGRPRFSRKSFAYTPAKTRKAEDTLTARVQAMMLDHAERQLWPTQLPVIVRLTFTLPIPPSWPKWRRTGAITGHVKAVSKPDVDNLVKLAKDALNGVVWVDDSQVVEVHAVKQLGDVPSTHIVVETLPNATTRAEAQR